MAAITTAAEYRAWNPAVSSALDSTTTTLISVATREAERATNRTHTTADPSSFQSQTFTEVFNGEGIERLSLRNTPVTSVTSVTLLAGDGSTLRTIAPTEYKFNPASGVLSMTPAYPGRFALSGRSTWGWWAGQEYVSDHGVRPRFSDQFRNVSVVYVGGYSTIPDDLKAKIWRIVDLLYKLKGNDFTVSAEGIGNRDVKYNTNLNQTMRDEIKAIMGTFMESPLP